MKFKNYIYLFSGFFAVLYIFPISAAGTYATGWVSAMKVMKLESRGVMFDSWEGEMKIISYESGEKCDDKKGECYTPVEKTIPFSVRKENADAIKMLNKFLDGGNFLVKFRKHRFEPLKLSTSFEVLEVVEKVSGQSEGIARQFSVKKTGSRNFSIKGDVVELKNVGCMIKTYEGLYRDSKTGKIHPFSVTQDEMAEHLFKIMKSTGQFHIGVSEAIVKGFRKSHYDIYEINLDRSALGIPEKNEGTDGVKKEPEVQKKTEPEVKKETRTEEEKFPSGY